MLIGVGIDLVSIERIKQVYLKYPDKFLKRIFTGGEQSRFIEKGASAQTLAAHFAAKEAVLKSIGCGIGPASLSEVEIISLGSEPLVRLHGEAFRLANKRNINKILISISHEPPFAAAMAAAANLTSSGNKNHLL